MVLKLKERKVIKINYSHLITLPKIWIENCGLKKGDKIDFEILENKDLLLRMQGGKNEK